jgi:hypothetical protein
VPAHLIVPWAAVTQFADPSVRFGLRFDAPGAEPGPDPGRPAAKPDESEAEPEPPAETPQVVSLDAFRKRPPRN